MIYACHFSFFVLDERQFRAVDLEEKIGFGFRKNFMDALKHAATRRLQEHLITLSPDRHPGSRVEHVVRRKFVVAGTRVAEFRVQPDEYMRFGGR